MAIYHFSVSVIRRSAGRSAVAAAAYRAGERLYDQGRETWHDYSRRRGIHGTEVLVPPEAPGWLGSRSALWNAVELRETRRNARVAREIKVALPRELSHDAMRDLVRRFVRREVVGEGMCADVAFHDLDGKNPHAHVLLSTREVTRDGFGAKVRAWDGWGNAGLLRRWREAWGTAVNEALADAGRQARVDHRSLAEQGRDRLATVHLGPKWTALNRERPDTPIERRDRRSQANAAVAAANGEAPQGRVPLERAARVAASHLARKLRRWHAEHDYAALTRAATASMPSPEAVLDRSAIGKRRREAAERLERWRDAVMVRMRSGKGTGPKTEALEAEAANAAALAAAARRELVEWTERQRRRLAGLLDGWRRRQQAARQALGELADLEAQRNRWAIHVEDRIPVARDRRRKSPQAA